jgi:o-succinylbenzoate synthase
VSAPLRGIRLFPYRLPLIRPWRFAGRRIHQRRGWLIRVWDRDGVPGWGEAAPLPEAGTETAVSTGTWLHAVTPALLGLPPDRALAGLPPATAAPPAARCGLEAALLDLAARQSGQPLARLLAAGAPDSVAVNAALGPLELLHQADLGAALAAGYSCLKLKLLTPDPDLTGARLRALDRRLPGGVVLRLDANRAWSPGAAAALLQQLPASRVELVEEPVAGDLRTLARLRAASPVPLALDESVTPASLERLLTGAAADLLVLKPMRLGGLLPCLEQARRARAAGLEVFVTGLLDGTPGTLRRPIWPPPWTPPLRRNPGPTVWPPPPGWPGI